MMRLMKMILGARVFLLSTIIHLRTVSCNYSDTAATTTSPKLRVNFAARNITQVLSTILRNYEVNVRPYANEKPLEVYVDITVLGINAISEKKMEFSFHCYFRQKWQDPRLRYKSDPTQLLPLNPQQAIKEFWTPDTYIRNGVNSFLHRLTVPNRMVRLKLTTGEVFISQRLTIGAKCQMDLHKFPMDTQDCPLIIGSLAYSNKDLQYKWRNLELDSALKAERDSHLTQFRLLNLSIEHFEAPSMTDISQNASLLRGRFLFLREKGYFLLQIYAPCSMIVMLSWVSFWINKEAAIARCSLGVMTVLSLTTLRQGIENEFPPVDYATAMDVFIFVSFFFCYSALVEYIVIHFRSLTRHKRSRNRRDKLTSALTMLTGSMLSGSAKAEETQNAKSSTGRSTRQTPRRNDTFGSLLKVRLDAMRKRTLADDACSVRERVTSFGVEAEDCVGGGETVTTRDERMPLMFGGGAAAKSSLGGGGRASAPRYSVEAIDYYSKYAFPAAFALFHVLYWLLYLFLLPD